MNDFPAKKKDKRQWLYIVGVVLLAIVIAVGVYFYKEQNKTVEIPLSEAIALSKDKVFSEMQVGNMVTLIVAEDVAQRATTDIEGKSVIIKGKQKIESSLMGYGVKDLKDLGFVMPPIYMERQSNWWERISDSPIIPPLLSASTIIALLVLMFKTNLLTGHTGGVFKKDKNAISFDDIGGLDSVKDNLMESVSFLRDRNFLEKLGARIPRGILLSGAPGTGKTMLAKAMATEAGVPFYYCAGSELQTAWFGMTGQKIRSLFKKAKQSPSIVFFDEIDSIAQRRSYTGRDVDRDSAMTVNQILAEMDGFTKESQVLVIAATNHPEVLDPALLRQGRFDRQISIPLPNFHERIDILKIHTKGKPFAQDVSLDNIAKSTSGMSGADLAGICNEASIIAGREHKDAIDMGDINKAVDRILAGCERKGTVYTEKEKRIVAYHEAGHALVASLLLECDKVQRISILPHNDAGGFTRLSSNEDKLFSKTKLKSMICMMLGGRVAEELVIGDVSNGAQSDLMKANQMATEMVEHYGMGEGFGLRFSYPINGFRDLSPDFVALIDKDVKSILDDCYTQAKALIEGKKAILEKLATRLIELEVMDADKVADIISQDN